MKIAIIRHSIRNRGGDRLILDYCSHLIQQGHEIEYYTNEINTNFRIDPKIQIKRIHYQGAIGTLLYVGLTLFKTDIVLVDLVIMSLVASFRNKRKVLYLAQDDDREYYSSPVLKLFVNFIYWLTIKILRIQIITVSEFLKQRLLKISDGKITAISNGIDHRIYYRENSSNKLQYKKTPNTIVLYARSDFRKGLDIGIKAISALAKLRGVADWELWTIGNDSVDININGLIIKNWGFLNETELRSVLSAADIYLSTSRHEGFGLMQLEAMACGCTMITTLGFQLGTNEVDSLVSSVEDWETLARNLNRVMSDQSLKNRLQINGYKLANFYSIEKSCQQFEKILLDFPKK